MHDLQPAAGVEPLSRLTDDDVYLFNEGTHAKLWDRLGAHPLRHADGREGTCFAVWAPNAHEVSVIGDFNGWHKGRHRLKARGHSGIFEGWIPGVAPGAHYKFHIRGLHGFEGDKADPFGFRHELSPQTASIVTSLDYAWNDGEWMRGRREKNSLDAPMSIYEVHLGSWMRVPEEDNRPLTAREAAPKLAEYVARMGFTHVEFLPVMEHPFGGSWGYQTTGYFAPTSRYGTPQDFKYLVDTLHQAGIGVILDWVPSHFPTDGHGLSYFDGTHLFEHADPRQGFHPDWSSWIFNYDRHEVRSFLMSSALFWLDRYHIDGLRVDAVASMLYLDYSRRDGEWIPNEHGGRENTGAIRFLRELNQQVYTHHPDVQTFAEESTAWPMVSRPVYVGGLGFGLKWDMGWMHDTLKYLARDPIHRRFHQNELTFRQLYATTENFVLPLSHDEVVHMKGSLLGKMPGDDWQAFANLRLMYAWMWAQAGKKLLFMGGEIAQRAEWNHESSVHWHELRYPAHDGIRRLVADLNRMYRQEPALHLRDCHADGFEWIDCSDADQSVLVSMRSAPGQPPVVCAFNFTPVPRENYRVGLPHAGEWQELLNTDSGVYGGSGLGNLGRVTASDEPAQGRPASASINVPPLGSVWLRPG